MDVRAFAKINNLIWDQLLATKAKIIQTLSCILVLCAKWNFCFCSLSKGIFNALIKVVRLASATECADSDK